MAYEIESSSYDVRNPDLSTEVTVIIPRVIKIEPDPGPDPPEPTPSHSGSYTKIVSPDLTVSCATTTRITTAEVVS